MPAATVSTIERHRGLIRGLLIFLAASPLVVGVWGLLAPRGFYDTFPGAGRHWVSALPPYNEHLLRDFAAADLGLTVMLVGAAVVMERRLVMLALAAWAVASLPHLAYHLTTTRHYATSDNVLSLAGLAAGACVPLAMIAMLWRPHRPPQGSS